MQWHTHEISNQAPDLQDYNIFTSDAVLNAGLQQYHAGWHESALIEAGEKLGSREVLEAAALANTYLPELHTHDRQGRRIDQVSFHPSWHQLLSILRKQGLHASPWSAPQPGAQVARAAGYFMQAQVEAGSLCPTTMTFASIPVLQQEEKLFAEIKDKLYSCLHDPRDLPINQKASIMIGMGMTEKQGGSDVRTNTSVAKSIGAGGRGTAYEITGHKWFFSAPMCDAHLVLANTNTGLSCFFVPRWRPDGSKNAVLIQRLKDKLGNRSNSSSEVEFQDAYGIMVGVEGRGIPTIIEMANLTRLDCVIGSAGLMRQALVQAIHHTSHRRAFGKKLIDQALMRNVLSDLALESEAATRLMLHLAATLDATNDAHNATDDALQRAWKRIMTPAAKFWVCKRALEFSGECMEVWGGNGYVESGPMARLYREAPVNSIWEGSGNVMCLDVLRAIERDPEGIEQLLSQWENAASSEVRLMAQDLHVDILAPAEQREITARRITQKLVLTAQAYLMTNHAETSIAAAFLQSRSDANCGRVFGTLDASIDAVLQERIITHAFTI